MFEDYHDLLTVSEVESLLSVSRSTVLKLLRAGILPGVKIGRQWRIGKDALLQYLNGEQERGRE